MGSSDHRVVRRDAISTLKETFGWTLNNPILIGVFFVVAFVDVLAELGGGLAFSLVGFLLATFAGGVAYVYARNELTDETTRFGDAADEVLLQALSLIGVALLYFTIVAVGFLLLILPGIYFGARLVLAFPACVLDGDGAFESLSTSWEAADGNVLKLVGLFVLSFAVIFGAIIVGLIAGLDLQTAAIVMTPVGAVLSPAVEMAFARVYLENRTRGVRQRVDQPSLRDSPRMNS